MLPLFMMKPTWVPWGALALPLVTRAAIGAHPGRSGELPGRAAGLDLVGTRRQARRLEIAVGDLVLRRRQRHQVDQGGVLAAVRVRAEELDRVRSGRNREIRRLVKTITWCPAA